MKIKTSGFTLIELLVVIAIIGILSSVVLASLGTARSKGVDTAIKADLAGVRNQAEIQYDTYGCYGNTAGSCTAGVAAYTGVCGGAAAVSLFANPSVSAALVHATTTSATLGACSITANATAWATVVQLKTTNTTGWCVDSTGKSKQVTLATADQAGVSAEVAGGACVE